MTDIYGYDTDSTITEVDLARAKSEGASYVAAYLGSGRNLTAAAVKLISDAGLKILSFSENHGARGMLRGAVAGTADAAEEVAHARAVGQPEGTCIFGADDGDTTPDEEPAVTAYMRSRAVVLRAAGYRPAYYGNGAMCKAMKAAGLADAVCVAGGSGMRGTREYLAAGGWDVAQDVGNKRHFNLHVSIDSESAADTLGLWAVGEPAPTPVPQPAPVQPPTTAPNLTAVLRLGVVDPQVEILQRRLTGLSRTAASPALDPQGVDGDFGPDTDAAVRAFQASRHLIVDGVIMPADPSAPNSGETWKELWL